MLEANLRHAQHLKHTNRMCWQDTPRHLGEASVHDRGNRWQLRRILPRQELAPEEQKLQHCPSTHVKVVLGGKPLKLTCSMRLPAIRGRHCGSDESIAGH